MLIKQTSECDMVGSGIGSEAPAVCSVRVEHHHRFCPKVMSFARADLARDPSSVYAALCHSGPRLGGSWHVCKRSE